MQLFTFVVTLTILMVANAMSRVKRADRSCDFYGSTYDSGSTFTYPAGSCFRYDCNDGSVSLAHGACRGNDGECHDVDSTWPEGCTTYKCSQNDLTFSSLVDSVECKDAEGHCHQPGETFPLVINGKRYNSCSCTINGHSVSSSCTG